MLHSPLGRLLGGLCALRFVGRVSGHSITLPVQCARNHSQVVIYVGHAPGKQWWRNFTDGHDVQVRVSGTSYLGRGHVVGIAHPARASAEQVYRRRYPKVEVARADPMVIIDLGTGESDGTV